jgi:hypothetical protein
MVGVLCNELAQTKVTAIALKETKTKQIDKIQIAYVS